ncbi:MAG TPA: ABC transporter transmembrane domain-containing protein, partial [Candidatus Paceibacterota bacterium]|nr:ABC transporter transmembrane domain-containing protein [Candidatus Paceibacterota bacterium]
MKLFFSFGRRYPWSTCMMTILMVLSTIAEGVSLSALVPMLATLADSVHTGAATVANSEHHNAITRHIEQILHSVGLTPTVSTLLTIIIGGFLLKNLFTLLANRYAGYTVARVSTDLRLELLTALLKVRWSYFVNHSVGSLTNSVTSEASRSAQAYLQLVTVLTFLLQVIVYGVVAALISWQATLVCIGVGIVIMAILNGLLRMSRRAGKKQTQVMRRLLARFHNTILSVKPLKAMAKEGTAGRMMRADTLRLNRTMQKEVMSLQVLSSAQETLFTIVIVVGFYYALVTHYLTLTMLVVIALLLARMLLQLGKTQRYYLRAVNNAEAYWSLIETIDEAQKLQELSDQPASQQAISSKPLLQHIRFDQVT